MKKFAAGLAVILVAIFMGGVALAADSFTVTAVGNLDADVGVNGFRDSYHVIKAAWKADSSGDKANGTIPAHKGRLIAITTDPGSTAPADNYDMTILDSNGVDITGGVLANRSTSASQTVQPLAGTLAWPYGRPIYGPLTVTFTAQATANCEGEIYLFIAE